MKTLICIITVSFCLLQTSLSAAEYDLVIYGSTPAGLAAAVQAGRMGKSAVVVSPETRVGGLSTGGLGCTDIGNKAAFGGIALEFYQGIAVYYNVTNDSMWRFEPSAACWALKRWEEKEGLVIHRGKRLDRFAGKVKVRGEGEQRRIVSFATEDGTEYSGKMFVDATYEGDLMAAAGVSYVVGREGNEVYGETVSGIQRKLSVNHQLKPGVDPYVVKGDPKSGLLPGVEADDPSVPDGAGDKRVQAYCYRMCLTDDPANRIPFAKPAGYDEKDYELLLRNFEAGETAIPWINSKMPCFRTRKDDKTDTNNRCGFSTDFIGQNHAWPEASYAEREKIALAHLKYQQGLMWTLANHPRVPEDVRREVSRWGTCKDEFAGERGDGWQNQLYVREARRLVGDVVMTEHHCRGEIAAARPVAMGAYGMDSHHCRRYVGKDGFVHNEGNIEDYSKWTPASGRKFERFPPYGIDYGAIIPKKGECANLFVPVCLSASHMAFGSIRMEPVFFALGQAAATAAAQAIDAGCAVQDLPYGPLRARLLKDGQVIGLSGSDSVKLASSFADGMVLQRDRKVPVWGTALAGATVTVSFAGQEKKATADKNGNWRVDLDPMPASKESRTLAVSTSTSNLNLKDVLVGEVWFCAGQSNMELPVVGFNPRFRDRQGAFVSQWLKRRCVRLCYASNYKWSATERTRAAYPVVWEELSPASLHGHSFSAVGVYFGLELHDTLDVPVGLVGTYWGGTNIDAWTPRCGTASRPDLKDVLDRRVCATEDAWRAAPDELRKGVFSGAQQQAGVLFNEMVAPWCPFAIRGFVWYQGCHNAGEYKRYASKMHALYNGWAEKFGNPDLKLYFCQLAPWGNAGIANIQMAQADFEREQPNAAMAVINDLGNLHDIHPNEKELVGKRLAAHALKRDYGLPIQDNSPTPKALVPVTNGVVKLTFNDAKGLYLYNPDYNTYSNGFEIAGADGVFHAAAIDNIHRYMVGPENSRRLYSMGTINADYVLLSSSEVKEPKKIRYLHSRPWYGSLYNEVNLPLGAFAMDVAVPRKTDVEL